MYAYAKSKVVKAKLKKQYPELAKIDTKVYSDIFDTLVTLNPNLLRTPFALSSLIKKHSEYGAIDTPTIQQLSAGKTRPNLGAELTKALMQSVMPIRETKGTVTHEHKWIE